MEKTIVLRKNIVAEIYNTVYFNDYAHSETVRFLPKSQVIIADDLISLVESADLISGERRIGQWYTTETDDEFLCWDFFPDTIWTHIPKGTKVYLKNIQGDVYVIYSEWTKWFKI